MYQLILGNKNYSSWSLRPWLAMKKGNVDFDEVIVPLYKEGTKQSLKAYSPSGKVPVLIAGDITIWDSLAICEFIAETESYLWPKSQKTRAIARSISHEMHAGFVEIRDAMPMNCRANNRNIDVTPAIKFEIERIETIWSENLAKYNSEGPWLFGEFSIADAMYAPIVTRFNTYGIHLNQLCNDYMKHMLNDEDLQQWITEAQEEFDVIEIAEVGE